MTWLLGNDYIYSDVYDDKGIGHDKYMDVGNGIFGCGIEWTVGLGSWHGNGI